MKQGNELTHPRVQELSKSRKQNQQTYIAVMDLFQQATDLVNGNILDKNGRPAPFAKVKINSTIFKVLFNGRALNFKMVKGKNDNEIEINTTITDILKDYALKQSEVELELDSLLTLENERTKEIEILKQSEIELIKENENLSKDSIGLKLIIDEIDDKQITSGESISSFINGMNNISKENDLKIANLKKLSFMLVVSLIGIVYNAQQFASIVG